MNSGTTESMELIDYAEREAEKKYDMVVGDFTALKTEVNALFAFVALAMSGAFSYAVSLLTDGSKTPALLIAISCVLIHLFICAVLLIWKCMMTGNFYHKGTESKNIFDPELKDYSVDEIRKFSLGRLDENILNNNTRNAFVGKWFNRVLIALLFAPATFGAIWGACAYFGRG